MTKEQCLRLLKLLSAMESWSFAKDKGVIPDYLLEELSDLMEVLTKEILK